MAAGMAKLLFIYQQRSAVNAGCEVFHKQQSLLLSQFDSNRKTHIKDATDYTSSCLHATSNLLKTKEADAQVTFPFVSVFVPKRLAQQRPFSCHHHKASSAVLDGQLCWTNVVFKRGKNIKIVRKYIRWRHIAKTARGMYIYLAILVGQKTKYTEVLP